MITFVVFISFIILLPHSSYQQTDCNNAPTPAFKKLCLSLRNLAQNERKRDSEIEKYGCSFMGSRFTGNCKAKVNEFGNVYCDCPPVENEQGKGAAGDPPVSDCNTLYCLCKRIKDELNKDTYKNYTFGANDEGYCEMPNGKPLRKAIRKEYRLLSDIERNKFHRALRNMTDNYRYINLNLFHHFALHHRNVAEEAGAHSGPGFLPWHREFLKRFENALRAIDPDVALPYWDVTIDQYLPDPRDSMIWSDELFGRTDKHGNVVTGPFANWRTLEGHPHIRRSVGNASQSTLFDDDTVQYWLSVGDLDRTMGYSQPREGCHIPPEFRFSSMEYIHGNVHNYVGGDMDEQTTTASDPIFYLLHTFVDFLWEAWRESWQAFFERAAYATDSFECSTAAHFSTSPMQPWGGWGLRNFHGASNMYIENLYAYEFSPSCPNNCNSRYLFCDNMKTPPRCTAKIRPGGNCQGFSNDDKPCYEGDCLQQCTGEFCIKQCIGGKEESVVPDAEARQGGNENRDIHWDSFWAPFNLETGKPIEYEKSNQDVCLPLFVSNTVSSSNLIESSEHLSNERIQQSGDASDGKGYCLKTSTVSNWLTTEPVDIVFRCADACLCDNNGSCWKSTNDNYETFILRPYYTKKLCGIFAFHAFSNDKNPVKMYDDQTAFRNTDLKRVISIEGASNYISIIRKAAPTSAPISIIYGATSINYDAGFYIDVNRIGCGYCPTEKEFRDYFGEKFINCPKRPEKEE